MAPDMMASSRMTSSRVRDASLEWMAGPIGANGLTANRTGMACSLTHPVTPSPMGLGVRVNVFLDRQVHQHHRIIVLSLPLQVGLLRQVFD